MDAKPLTPEARARREQVRGTPCEVGDHAWTLADYVPALGPVWDRLYDGNVLYRKYDELDVLHAAVLILRENYDLSIDEAVALVRSAPAASLVAPVEAALFGSPMRNRSYSCWVLASLRAGGIDPDDVPPGERYDLLDALLGIGLAPDPAAFISSQAASARRHKILNLGKD